MEFICCLSITASLIPLTECWNLITYIQEKKHSDSGPDLVKAESQIEIKIVARVWLDRVTLPSSVQLDRVIWYLAKSHNSCLSPIGPDSFRAKFELTRPDFLIHAYIVIFHPCCGIAWSSENTISWLNGVCSISIGLHTKFLQVSLICNYK